MTLDQELRAALSLEAEMLNATRPDVDRLITGGRARRRRRNVLRAGGAALAVVLIGGGAYAVTQIDRSDADASRIANQPTTTSEPTGSATPPALALDSGPEHLEPGTYRVVVGADATGGQIEADLTFEGPGWDAGNFPTVSDDERYGGLGVYRPDALPVETGCSDHLANADVGESPRALAQQLAQLPESTVLQPVTPTQLLGYDAQHLQLRIRDDCPKSLPGYHVAETPRGSRGISYSNVATTVVMDFWVLDLDGVPVVVDTWHMSGVPSDVVDRIAQARDSIRFVAGE